MGRWISAVRRWWQRRTRGWDDSEIWSLDYTLCCWIVPRLRLLKKETFGHPPDVSWDRWHEILDQMIDGFSIVAAEQGWPLVVREDGSYDRAETDAQTTRVELAFRLFGEYAGGLWT